MIKFLIGGSPCTHWSIAQSKHRETKAEGLGWELFRNYLIAKEKFKPDFFLYENNKSVDKAIKAQISAELGVPLQHINSALVSAQKRERFYAHNFGDVPQPEDRGILLQDILENGMAAREKSCCIDAHYYKGGNLSSPHKQSGKRLMVYEPIALAEKSQTILSTIYKENALSMVTRGKTGLFCAFYVAPPPKKGVTANKPVRLCKVGNGGQGCRIYDISGKSVCLSANGGGWGGRTGLYACPADTSPENVKPINNKIFEVKDGYISIKDKVYKIKLPDGFYAIRKLTVTEASRLQTMPDDYCRAVSASQGYKGLGNGWTAEVVVHLLSHALKGVPKDEEITVLSMYDGIATGRYCFDKLGYTNIAYYAYEIDKYPIQIALSNYPDIIQCGDAFQVRNDGWRLEKSNFSE